MKETLEILTSYMELYECSEEEKREFLKSQEIQMYALLRDRLTYPELVELQIILENIYTGFEEKDKIDFNEYIYFINKKYLEQICNLYELEECSRKKEIIYGICTIIAMDPKEVVNNYLINN